MSFAILGGALIGGTMGLIGAGMSSNAAENAAEAQGEASNAAIAEQRRQFDEMQKLLAPYVQTGNKSLTAQSDLAGLNGPEAQRLAMEQISGSPEMMALTQQGENAMLQQGAATGGLRGGNMQGALAQFRPQMLSSLINQQYGRLGGLTQMGQASAAGVGAAGMNMGQNIGNLQMAAGNANANAQLASGQAWANVPNYFFQGGMMGYGLNNNQVAPPGTTPGIVPSSGVQLGNYPGVL